MPVRQESKTVVRRDSGPINKRTGLHQDRPQECVTVYAVCFISEDTSNEVSNMADFNLSNVVAIVSRKNVAMDLKLALLEEKEEDPDANYFDDATDDLHRYKRYEVLAVDIFPSAVSALSARQQAKGNAEKRSALGKLTLREKQILGLA